MLVLAISEDLDKLLKNGGLAAVASLGKGCGIMVVTVDIAFVLVIAVLCAKDGRTYRAREMLDVVLALKRSNI